MSSRFIQPFFDAGAGINAKGAHDSMGEFLKSELRNKR